MNNFKDGGFKKKGNNFGGNSKFGGGGRGNRSGRGGGNKSEGSKFGGNKSGGRQTELFKAECSKCHKDCTLPFRPATDKSVFCSDCFAKKNSDNDRGEGRRGNDRGNRNENSKPPRSERSPRHDRAQAHLNKEMIEVKRQLETIESRLNRILDIISQPKDLAEKFKEEKTAIEAPEIKAVTKTAKKVAKKAMVKVVAKKSAPAKKTVKKVAAKKVTK